MADTKGRDNVTTMHRL